MDTKGLGRVRNESVRPRRRGKRVLMAAVVVGVAALVILRHQPRWIGHDIGEFQFASEQDDQGIARWRLTISPSVWMRLEPKVDISRRDKMGPLEEIVNDAIRDPNLCAGGWNFDYMKKALVDGSVVFFGHCERPGARHNAVDNGI
jgi:hypothetical protein